MSYKPYPAHKPTSAKFSISKSLSDKHLLAVFFGSAFVLWLSSIAGSQGIQALSALPLALLLGYVTLLVVLFRMKGESFLTSRDAYLLSLLSLFFVIPIDWVMAIIFTFAGILLCLKKDKDLVSLGQISIGIAWISFWGPVLLVTLAPWLMSLETWVAYLPLHMIGDFKLVENSIYDNTGHSVVVYSQCSAFNNTIRTAFIWLCLVKLCDFRYQSWQVYGLLFTMTWIIGLNCARISLMATSNEKYDYWHNGYGTTLYSHAMTFSVFGIFYILASNRPGNRRGNRQLLPRQDL